MIQSADRKRINGHERQSPDDGVLVLDGALCIQQASARASDLLGVRAGDRLEEVPGLDVAAAREVVAESGEWMGRLAGTSLRLRLQGVGECVVAVVSPHDGGAGDLDPLTGLPGRHAFARILEGRVAGAERTSDTFGLLLVDLNDFASINDAFGAEFGDGVLQQAAERLAGLLGPADRLARVGGDRFAIIQAAPHMRMLSRDVLQCLGGPLGMGGRKVTLTASVGMSFYPGDGTSAEALSRRAAMALREAQAEGGDGYRFYRTGMDRDARLRCALEHDMAGAIERGEFLLHYQPQTRLDSGEVVGCEALLRWRHPEHGLLLPGRFIAAAEANGCIGALGDWVLRRVCEQLADWRAIGDGPGRVAVNLSACQLHDRYFPQRLAAVLRDTGVDPQSLELELTESVALRNSEHTAEAVARVRDLGVEFVIDDFGAGYSSLHALEFIPARVLKLDRSLTCALRSNQRQAAIARAAIDLGHKLGMQVLAEGIEGLEQAEVLRGLRCDLGQGHAIGFPVPPMELCAWLRNIAAHSRQSASGRDRPVSLNAGQQPLAPDPASTAQAR